MGVVVDEPARQGREIRQEDQSCEQQTERSIATDDGTNRFFAKKCSDRHVLDRRWARVVAQ